MKRKKEVCITLFLVFVASAFLLINSSISAEDGFQESYHSFDKTTAMADISHENAELLANRMNIINQKIASKRSHYSASELIEPASDSTALVVTSEEIPENRTIIVENGGISPYMSDTPLPKADPDTDGDHVKDSKDDDDDNDGIPDLNETSPTDTDGDGLEDRHDLDSDNDGIPDAVEAGSTDVDENMRIGHFVDNSKPKNGLNDSIDPKEGGTPLPIPDTDADGTRDFRDTDSDNDTIPDSTEAGPDPIHPLDTDGDGISDYREIDSDNDTINDSVEAGPDPSHPPDTDGDGISDYREIDSDNDTINDSVEAGPDPSHPLDTDNDGTPDYLDTDSDNDTILDSAEVGPEPSHPLDTDSDGVPDYLDLDSDGDGASDEVEAGSDPSNPVDTDGDGVPDYLDQDSDGDGLNDTREGWWLCSRTDPDTNGDQINDSASINPDNPDRTYPYRSEDISSDNDVDGDGLPDAAEMHEVGTDFKIFSTDGDPYGDGQEYFHVNMPEIPVADSPFVAAYPALSVRLNGIKVTPIGEITTTKGGSKQTAWSLTTETSNSVSHSLDVGVEWGGTISATPEAHITYHANYIYQNTHTTTNTKTDSGFTQNDWSTAVTTKPNEAAKLALTMSVMNSGTAPAESIVPNVNIKLGEMEIATITSTTSITHLDMGETSARFVVDQGLVGIQGEDIIVSLDQLKSIDIGTPLSIEGFEINAKVKRWDDESGEWVCVGEDFATYMREIDERCATLMFELEGGVYKEYKVYASSSTTIGDALNWTIISDESVPPLRNIAEWSMGFYPKDAYMYINETLSHQGQNLTDLELKPGWMIIMNPPKGDGPIIHWAEYSEDMRGVNASVTDNNFRIASVNANVKIGDSFVNLTMTDDNNDTIYEASTTHAMERDRNATILATNVNNSTSQLKIGTLPGSVEAPFSDSGRYVITSKSSGKCLDGSDKENDYNARQYKGGLGPKQRWYLEDIGSGYYTIRNNESWFYLEVDHGRECEGANVQSGVLKCDGDYCPTMSQQWYFEPDGEGYYKIGARHSDNCLSIESASTEDNASIIQDKYMGGDHQKWMVEPLESYPSAIWNDSNCTLEDEYLIEAKHSLMCLSEVEGSEVVQSVYAGEVGQNWKLKPVGDGYFKIINAYTGNECLATSDQENTSNGVDVIAYNCNESDNQMWRFEPAADGYYKIVCKYSDKCLEVSDGIKEDGANVQQYDYRGYDHQRWRIVKKGECGVRVALFSGANYQGFLGFFPSETKDLGVFDNMVRSLKIVAPSKYAIILYDDKEYRSSPTKVTRVFVDNLVPRIDEDFTDSVSSFKAEKIEDLYNRNNIRIRSLANGHYLVNKDEGECDECGEYNCDVGLDTYVQNSNFQMWKLSYIPSDETYNIFNYRPCNPRLVAKDDYGIKLDCERTARMRAKWRFELCSVDGCYRITNCKSYWERYLTSNLKMEENYSGDPRWVLMALN